MPLLTDPDVNYVVPRSLGQIVISCAFNRRFRKLSNQNPNMRVLAIYALEELKAVEALPRLRQLLGDNERCNFDKLESVAQAAQAAIAELQIQRDH